MKPGIQLIAAALIALGAVQAATPAAGKSPAGRFIVAQAPENPAVCIVLTADTRYAFSAPRNWTVIPHASNRAIAVKDPGGKHLIDVRFRDDAYAGSLPQAADWFRQLAAEYSGAKLQDQPEVAVFNRPAPALDVAWSLDSQAPRAGRFVRVPLSRGYIEARLVTGFGEDFETALPSFMQFLVSFRAAPEGENLVVRKPALE